MTSPYWRDIEKFWGAPVPPNLVHGPQTRAKRAYGCDCKTCLPSGKRHRKAWRDERPFTSLERQRRSQQNLRGQAVPPETKHGLYTYRTYGCRCEVCREAKRLANHKSNHPWMYRQTDWHWHVGEEVTKVCKPDPITRRCPHG